MTRKIICYDLHGQNPDAYKAMYDLVERKYNGIRATESVYICFTSKTVIEIRDELSNRFGSEISILVNEFPCGVATYNISSFSKFKMS